MAHPQEPHRASNRFRKSSTIESSKSGRTMKQIAEDRDAEWETNRNQPKSDVSSLKSRISAALKKKVPREKERVGGDRRRNKFDRGIEKISLSAAKPRFVEPMKPRLVEEAPSHGDWLYELKFDGIRVIAVKNEDRVNLISRNGNELRARFPEIAEAVKQLPVRECVIDGEVVALDEEGRSSFQLLQSLEMDDRKAPVRFYVFDLLQLNGKGLLKLPLTERKAVLSKLCEGVRRSDSIFRRARRRSEDAANGRQGTRPRRHRRQATRFTLRTGKTQRSVDQTQVRDRTGICYRRLHATARRAQIFWRRPGWLLRKKKLLFAGKVGTGFDRKCWPRCIRNSKRENAPIVLSPICHRSKAATGCRESHLR